MRTYFKTDIILLWPIQALVEECSCTDHHIDIILYLTQWMIVIIGVHHHLLPQGLSQQDTVTKDDQNIPHLHGMVELITLAGRNSQVILA